MDVDLIRGALVLDREPEVVVRGIDRVSIEDLTQLQGDEGEEPQRQDDRSRGRNLGTERAQRRGLHHRPLP